METVAVAVVSSALRFLRLRGCSLRRRGRFRRRRRRRHLHGGRDGAAAAIDGVRLGAAAAPAQVDRRGCWFPWTCKLGCWYIKSAVGAADRGAVRELRHPPGRTPCPPRPLEAAQVTPLHPPATPHSVTSQLARPQPRSPPSSPSTSAHGNSFTSPTTRHPSPPALPRHDARERPPPRRRPEPGWDAGRPITITRGGRPSRPAASSSRPQGRASGDAVLLWLSGPGAQRSRRRQASRRATTMLRGDAVM